MALSRLVRLPNGLSKTFWPRYRGKRAGRLVKDRENDRCHLISVAQPRGLNRVATLTRLHRFRNLANLISVTTTPASPKKGSTTAYVPSFLVSHVMSLATKINEFINAMLFKMQIWTVFASQSPGFGVIFTTTWLL